MQRVTAALILVLAALCQHASMAQERSGPGEREVRVTLQNATGRTVDVVWVDQRGREEEHGEIPPGGRLIVDAYDSHLFRFKIDGKGIGSYRLSSPTTYTIRLPGAPSASTVRTTPTAPPAPGAARSAAPGEAGRPNDARAIGSTLTAAEAASLLSFHNSTRAAVKVRPLAWASRLAAIAQEWANRIAATDEFEHRPQEGPDSSFSNENLAIATTVLEGARSWYSERALFRPGTKIDDDNYLEFGHYTQMIWHSTTSVGCGKAVMRRGQYKGQLVLVCNYDPSGNVIGEAPY
jgi:pathogenesis-related protein 1